MTSINKIAEITSTVRGGGSGARAWVAKIVGPHPKFGFERAFIQADKQVSRSGKSGYIDFPITEPGFYEVRGVQLDKGDATIGQLWDGFIRVTEAGEIENISAMEIKF